MIQLGRLLSTRSLARHGVKGQIAIFLMLAIVGVLIFAIATANMGAVTVAATKVANAADSAALGLASQLATKGNTLSKTKGLDGRSERCQVSGMGAILSGGFGALAGFLLAPLTGGSSLVLAIVGGAIGGAIGGALVQGTAMGALMGAVQGALIGATIGYGEVLGAGFAGSEGAIVPVVDVSMGIGEAVSVNVAVPAFGSISGATSGLATGATVMSGATPLIAGSTLAGAGAAAAGAISVASNLYVQSVKDQMKVNAITKAAKALSRLPAYEQLREGVFYAALSDVVEDPNQTEETCYWPDPTPVNGDPNDSDGDGDTSNVVPCFQVWWDNRVRSLSTNPALAAQDALVKDFLAKAVKPFQENAETFMREIDRRDVECASGKCPASRNGKVDGRAVELWRALTTWRAEQGRPPLSFWAPGPDRTTLLQWYQTSCEAEPCAVPGGYDAADAAHKEYEIATYVFAKLREAELRDVEAKYSEWIRLLYDPKHDGDFSDMFGAMVDGMGNVIDETQTARTDLPRCRLAYGNYPSATTVRVDASNECGPAYSDENPVETCAWQHQSSTENGTHLTNAPCKIDGATIDEGDQKELTTQIARAEAAVRGLEQRIKDSYVPTCPIGSFVKNDRVSDILASLSDNTLHYTFNVTFTCRECQTEWGYFCDAPCADPKETECTRYCSREVCRNPQFTRPGVDHWPDFGAPDLTVEPLMSHKTFIEVVLDDYRVKLRGLATDSHGTFATIDQDLKDEFQPVVKSIRSQQAAIRRFLPQVRAFYEEMERRHQGDGSAPPRASNGAGSVEYKWRDSRGKHIVTVETGPFIVPHIETKSSGSKWWRKKTCVYIADATDGGRAWVKITRKEPSSSDPGERERLNMGLWRWNPFVGPIVKKSCGAYDYNAVGLGRCP